ncbi:bifunctional aspartate kinase/homoserine dehydrogenase I [Bacteroidetes bacterium endosymbiont of Geopemphigus sp.]|uniref:bifunctional aspartate kinase/homoserine dehydrogenase I n=1 Tax=Bacteroidetes bacterium endosymbiont of Geopemphigus sp. TaxID=2047937 RepID=UPI000CD24B1D|nr:bifunctional aspartate kinase/homoserine dehydrogenase I [Bacteroidetes bacterium endosymbiont of Geopemphigus sp.]
MKVLKFGGTSVGNPCSIKQICKILKDQNSTHRYVIIVSALGGVTDMLVTCGKLAAQKDEKYCTLLEEIEMKHMSAIRELFSVAHQSHLISRTKKYFNALEIFCDSIFHVLELSRRSLDKIMSFGELISSYLISEKLKESGFKASWKDSRELIITDEYYGSAQVDLINSYGRIQDFFSRESTPYVVMPGFIAASAEHETTTLGRGGSDYSAAIVAAALRADALEIWTDVNGMMTADPKIVSQAFTIENLSYKEAMELSHFGAKVIYPPTLQPVMERRIPVFIKNTFVPSEKGTCIAEHNMQLTKPVVTGISGIQNLVLLTLEGSGMIGIPGYSKRLFATLAYQKINVIFITQSSSEHSITVGIKENDLLKAKSGIDSEFAEEIYQKRILPVSVEKDLCIIAVIGDDMKNTHGTSGRMFSALGKNSINIRAIAQGSNEKNISAVIAKNNFKKALNILHEIFFERPAKQINLFVVGAGQVGRKLLEQLSRQRDHLIKELKLQIRIIGLANSKNMYFEELGMDLGNWQKSLKYGEPMALENFIKKIYSLNLRNSVFVDNTASEELAGTYAQFLAKGIGVITCNKIACASSYESYKNLKNLARYFNAPFFFETNVGAGLPIISTLNDLVHSGDKIHLIEAVLSGSLNFIFNNFKADRTFADTVHEAQEKGYTEPDPRIDLSGIDVMRKILILVRECGESIELDDIIQKSFLPEACEKAKSVEDFYKSMVRYENHFVKLREEAENNGKRLRFMAKYEHGKASVGLQAIGVEHPFYQLEGKDNMILYTTQRYAEQPLIVKGAGAGAEVTASGIFSDIIKASR